MPLMPPAFHLQVRSWSLAHSSLIIPQAACNVFALLSWPCPCKAQYWHYGGVSWGRDPAIYIRGPDDARSFMVNQRVAPGWHTEMALHGGRKGRELDGEKCYGRAPAALDRSLKEDISLGASVSLTLLFLYTPPCKGPFTVGVNVCHQLQTLPMNICACETSLSILLHGSG